MPAGRRRDDNDRVRSTVEPMNRELPDQRVTVHSAGHTGDTLRPFAGEQKVPWQESTRMDKRLKFVARLLQRSVARHQSSPTRLTYS